MSNQAKDKLKYILLFIFILIIPNLLFYYFESEDKKIFYSRMDEDNEICYERAKRDSAYTEFCNQIQRASEKTFRSSRSSNNFYLLIFQPILFVLVVATWNLKKQVEELKEKLDDSD